MMCVFKCAEREILLQGSEHAAPKSILHRVLYTILEGKAFRLTATL